MEVDAEQVESGALDVVLLERELAAMKAKIEAIQKQIDNYSNEH